MDRKSRVEYPDAICHVMNRGDRRRLEQSLEERRRAGTGDEFKAVRRGWCLGEEGFRKDLLAQMSGRIGAEHYGAERAETDVAKAERLIATELKRRVWTEATLPERFQKADRAVLMEEFTRLKLHAGRR